MPRVVCLIQAPSLMILSLSVPTWARSRRVPFAARRNSWYSVNARMDRVSLTWLAMNRVQLVRSESALAAANATPACVAGKRVLVADDNATNLSLLREMLLKDGHQVTAVESGHEAIVMLSANTYDVVFLDYNMDDINGAVVYQTYAYSRVQLAPTFFITADTTAMTTRLLEDLGANGVIYKPLTFEKIRQAIASVFPDEARPVPAEPLRPRQGAVAISGVPVEYLDPSAIEGLREIKDSPDFLHAVITDGIADIHVLHQALADAIDGADLPGLHKQAHAMKGVALSLGVVRLAHLADRLMTMTHDVLTGSAPRWHEDLDACVARPQGAQTAERVLALWLEANGKPGTGVAWKVGHAGHRLLAWLVRAPLILSGPDKPLRARTLGAMEQTARWLDRNHGKAEDKADGNDPPEA